MSIRNLCICMSVNVALWIVAVIVFKTVPSPTMEYCMASIMILMVACFAVTMLFDPPTPALPGFEPNLRDLVHWALVAKLDNAREITEKAFVGRRVPKGYVHVFVTDTDRSFQLFFATTSSLLKVARVTRSVFMNLEGCDVLDKVSSCGMRGFTAVSEVRNERYKVLLYRNPLTRHIRVYVCVQTPSQTNRVHESA